MLKRILAVMLVFVMLLGTLLLTACNSTEGPANDTTTAKPADTNKPVGGDKEPTREDASPATNQNYAGRKYGILACEGTTFLEPNETMAQSLGEITTKRTMYIEDTYGIEFDMNAVYGHDDYDTLQASYLGGDQLYDLIMPHPTVNFTPIITSGMMQDLNDSSTLGGHIDTTKLWWNQSNVETYTIDGRLFLCNSDAQLGIGSFIVLDKEKYDAMYTDEDIYDVIFDGKWTMQRVIDIATENYDTATGEYGYAMHKGHVSGFYFSCGETLLKRTEDGGYELKFDVDKTEEIAKKVYNLVIGDHALLDQWWNSTFLESKAWKAFSSREVMMLYMDLGAFGNMVATLDFKTVYTPLPKFDEVQENYLSVAGGGCVGIPNDAKDLVFAAFILEVYNWYSYNYYRPVYIDSYLSALIAKNENDYKIFNDYLNNRYYDLGYILDSVGTEAGKAIGLLHNVVVENMSTDVSSYIEQYEESCNNQFQEIIDQIY